MSILKPIIAILILVSASFAPSLSQSSMITWYEKATLGSEIISMETPVQDGDFLYTAVTLFSQGWSNAKYQMLRITQDGIVEKMEPLTEDKNGHLISFQQLGSANGELYGYYEIEEGDKSSLYRDEIDKNTLAFKGHELKIDSGKKGKHKPGAWTWRSSVFAKDLRIEDNFFTDGYFYLQYGPALDFNMIMKLEPSEAKSKPRVKVKIYNNKLELVNSMEASLPGNNVDTELIDAEADQEGNIYLISAEFVDKVPVYTLSVGKVNTESAIQIKIPLGVYYETINASSSPLGLSMVCLAGEDRKDKLFDLTTMSYDVANHAISKPIVLAKDVMDEDDKLYCLSSRNSFFIATQDFADSRVISTPNGTQLTSRSAGDVNTYNLDFNGNLLSKNTIKNYVSTPGGSNLYDGVQLFGFNDLFYLLYNIHPENPALAAKGAKLKTGYPLGKEKMATELVRFDTDGSVHRKLIYTVSDKIVTVPTLTRYIGNHDFMVIGDKANIGNSFHFGKFSIKEEED